MKREKCYLKKKITVWWKYIFSKLLLINFGKHQANRQCQRTTNLFMADLLPNRLSEKIKICW